MVRPVRVRFPSRAQRQRELALVTKETRAELEAALIARVSRGDADALAELYDRYSSLLLAVAHKMLGPGKEAEDLLHDVFLEVWRHAGGYDRTRGTVGAWLLVRMRSRALDRRRTRARSRLVLFKNGRVPDGRAPSEDPVLIAERVLIRRAVEALPAELRVVLELGYFAGLTSSEIAKQIDVPLGTVKSRLSRGLLIVRAALNGEDP